MSFPVIIRSEAEADLTEGFNWYEERRDGLGFEFLREVKMIQDQLRQNPLRHAVIYRNVRRALVRRFPYKVFYLFEHNKVEVIGVIHASRHRRSWQQRVQ